MLDYQFDGLTLQLTNFTDLSFAQSDYEPSSNKSFLAISPTKPTSQDYLRVEYTNYQSNTNDSIPNLQFGFGLVYEDGSEYFSEMLNTYDGQTTQLTLDANGLVLPGYTYSTFIGLLNVATKGNVTCVSDGVTGCYLPDTCAQYPTMWDYSFKIQFDGQEIAD